MFLVALLGAALVTTGCSTTLMPQWTPPPCDGPTGSTVVCGPHAVAEYTTVFRDPSRRNRAIPAKVYVPQEQGSYPTILFSHGLGNSHEGYRYLGRVWASQGYASVHITHRGSDRKTLLDHNVLRLVRALFDPVHFRHRMKDLAFAHASLVKLQQSERTGPVPVHRLDLKEVALAGHSYGAVAALQLAGEPGALVDAENETVPVRAVIALSPARMSAFNRLKKKNEVTVPILYMTGSDDTLSAFFGKKRRSGVPFKEGDGIPQYVVVFDGATHGTFSDDEEEPRLRHEDYIRMTQQATTRFLDAHLGGISAETEAAALMLETDEGASATVY